jgi:NADPH:quinone reductase-like Zn-dependent oxidoreductase
MHVGWAFYACFNFTTERLANVVLTEGTGGVSIFAVQFARAAGATVIAASSSDEKLARLKDLGTDHLINNKSDPKWGRSAAAWTAGQGHGFGHVQELTIKGIAVGSRREQQEMIAAIDANGIQADYRLNIPAGSDRGKV